MTRLDDLSATQTLCIRKNSADVARSAANIGWTPDKLEEKGFVGKVKEILNKMGYSRTVGQTAYILRFWTCRTENSSKCWLTACSQSYSDTPRVYHAIVLVKMARDGTVS